MTHPAPQSDSSESKSLSASVLAPDELSPIQRQTWIEMQEGNPDLQEPYFRVEFVEAVSRYRSNVRVAVFEKDEKPIAFWAYQEILPGIGQPVGEKIGCLHGIISPQDFPYSAEVLARKAGLRTWHFDHLPVSQSLFSPYHSEIVEAPYMDLSEGFESYLAQRKEAGHSNSNINNTLRKRRKLERELGSVSFEADTKDPKFLTSLTKWKREQMKATGVRDFYLHAPWVSPLSEEMLRNDSDAFRGMVSAITLNGEPIAALYGLRSYGVFHGLFLAYNDAYAKYSPGMLLLLELAKNAQDLGLKHIDMGKGPAPYKQTLKSGSNLLAVGVFDQNPLRASFLRQAHRGKAALAHSPIGPPLRRTAGRILRGIDWALGRGK